MLKLTAEIEARDSATPAYALVYTVILVSVNGEQVGWLRVLAEHADELVNLLNAATEMHAALRYIADTKNYHAMKGHACDVLRRMKPAT